jgi:hypothetical protein
MAKHIYDERGRYKGKILSEEEQNVINHTKKEKELRDYAYFLNRRGIDTSGWSDWDIISKYRDVEFQDNKEREKKEVKSKRTKEKLKRKQKKKKEIIGCIVFVIIILYYLLS